MVYTHALRAGVLQRRQGKRPRAAPRKGWASHSTGESPGSSELRQPDVDHGPGARHVGVVRVVAAGGVGKGGGVVRQGGGLPALNNPDLQSGGKPPTLGSPQTPDKPRITSHLG